MTWRRANLAPLALILVLVFSVAAADRVRLAPKFSPGGTIRYSIASSTKSTGKTTAPIVNPEGGSQSSGSIHMLVRIEVLSLAPDGSVRLRATYENSAAESQADALDLSAGSFASRYKRLEGRTFEFTLAPGGAVTNIQDLTAATSGQSPNAIDPALSWLQNVWPSSSFPKNGVSIGQKWKSERLVEGALLSGLTWRGESTYLRNEACGSALRADQSDSPVVPSAPALNCAVILTHFEITRQGSTHTDATPDDFRRKGLRTSGTWTGTGESLDSYSLATGLLVSSTQSNTQNMDYQVTSASTGSSIRYIGKVQTQAQITQVTTQP
jgi:hypothetical protein